MANCHMLCWALVAAIVAAAEPSYTNPIVQEQLDLGDPGALYLDGFYYLATSSGDVPDAFPIHRSADLASWELVGHVFPHWEDNGPSWAAGDFWAPDLQLVNGRPACYFSARSKGGLLSDGILSLGVAFSEGNITGPFADAGQPLLADGSNIFGTIDVHFHQTSDGSKYLLWKKNQNVLHLQFSAHLMMQRLNDDGASLSNEPAVSIAAADQAWEKYGCIEAPWLIERNKTFYLFYSGSMVQYNSYAVGVARADTIEGPYVKKPEPVIHGCDYQPPTAEQQRFLAEAEAQQQDDVAVDSIYTPGHCSVLAVQGQTDRWVMFYHGRDIPNKNPYRWLMMDELRWGADGWPYIDGDCPSSASLPVP